MSHINKTIKKLQLNFNFLIDFQGFEFHFLIFCITQATDPLLWSLQQNIIINYKWL